MGNSCIRREVKDEKASIARWNGCCFRASLGKIEIGLLRMQQANLCYIGLPGSVCVLHIVEADPAAVFNAAPAVDDL